MKLYFLIPYCTLQLLVFALYGIDKYKAQKQKNRISEKMLLTMTAIGPFGAYMGMHVFRHKTKKLYFWLMAIGMVIVHAGLAMLYFYAVEHHYL